MSVAPPLLDLMPHTISVKPMASVDEYGEPTYGAAVSYECLVVENPALVLNQFGEEVVTRATAYVNSSVRIDVTSEVTLPDGSVPSVTRSDVFFDETGDVYCVVMYFGG